VDAPRLSERIMRRILSEHPPLRQYPALWGLLSCELGGDKMQALVEDITRCLGASSDEGLRSRAVTDIDASTARAQLSAGLEKILEGGELGELTEALEKQVDRVLVDHERDAAGWELSRRLDDAGHHGAAGLAVYYQREASAAFLPARHQGDESLVAEDHALVGAIGTITGTINKQHKQENYTVMTVSFESSVPQSFNLGVGKYDVFARKNDLMSIDQIGEAKISRSHHPTSSEVLVDLLPYLTELPQECTLLFEERKYFTGCHEKSLHSELVYYKAGAPGQKSLFARFLSGDGA